MGDDAQLALAMASFVGTHFLLSHPLRETIVKAVGPQAFLGIYSLVAAITLGWTIYARVTLPTEAPLWVAPLGLWHGADLVMLLASILMVGALIGNPAMVDPTGRPKFPVAATGVLAITRHPLMWAFMLWCLVHATLWGTPGNLVITGGIFILALFGALGQDAKKARLIGASWREWQGKTSFVPFAALLAGRARWRDAIPGPVPLIGGLLLWAGATYMHAVAGGLIVGPWRWLAVI